MAIGGDQGGSIRIPAAYCGVYGLKPTHGLVPYTGVFPIENTLDHTGPMTATVADNALLLEVLAGPDGLDPRQVDVKSAAYTNALTGDVRGMKIAVVKEGFGHPNSEADVDLHARSEEQTSELQSRFDLVCRLLLETKKISPRILQAIQLAAIAYPTTKTRVDATGGKCPHKVRRMEMQIAISCTILRNAQILISVDG